MTYFMLTGCIIAHIYKSLKYTLGAIVIQFSIRRQHWRDQGPNPGLSNEGTASRCKYTIKMEGRQVGKVVMFKGTTDLGANDGGVFDWIGRANEKEFVRFFTSAFYTGTFTLSRPIQPAN